MPEGQMNEKVEEMLRMPAEELKYILPLTLDEIRRYGTVKTLGEIPDLLSKIIGKLVEVDAAKFLSEAPEISDKFMDLLWEGVGSLSVKFEELRSALDRTNREINVNIEASDSPLRGHFIISQGKLSGGSGLLHFKEEDYKFMGPTEVLMGLLTWELALGLSNLKLQTAGHSGFQTLVSPIIQGISKLIKGK
jgi:hypothetical protein